MRSKWLQRWHVRVPQVLRLALAKRLLRQHQEDAAYANDAPLDTLETLFADVSVQKIVHGHTHYPLQQLFDLEKGRTRFVLAAWGDNGNCLRISPTDVAYLIFSNKTDLSVKLASLNTADYTKK